MAFLTIEPTPGLGSQARRRSHAVGPPAVAVRTSYRSLLRSAGFRDVEVIDKTAAYHDTQRRWLDASVRHERDLRAALGDDMVDDGYVRRRRALRGLDDGLLIRRLYTARVAADR